MKKSFRRTLLYKQRGPVTEAAKVPSMVKTQAEGRREKNKKSTKEGEENQGKKTQV